MKHCNVYRPLFLYMTTELNDYDILYGQLEPATMSPTTRYSVEGRERAAGSPQEGRGESGLPGGMLFTFDSSTRPTPSPSPGPSRGRIRTRRACDECRKRKAKCDGNLPCGSCQHYNKQNECRYSDTPESVTNSYEAILRRLFPGIEPSSLMLMPTSELRKRAMFETFMETTTSPTPSVFSAEQTRITDSMGFLAMTELESLQTLPAGSIMPPESDTQVPPGDFSDDVNMLGLFTRAPSSYLGASSILAVLKVIQWIKPEFRQVISNEISSGPFPTGLHSPDTASFIPRGSVSDQQIRPVQEERKLVEAFFSVFHLYTPIINEEAFRRSYDMQDRDDDRWLALVNIVLALGSIAANPTPNNPHYLYYQRSKNYIKLDTLGTPHLETIQALGLMAGHYLHYISQPNLAISLMGTALRLATSIGLHRESNSHATSTTTIFQDQSDQNNIRRRVWWCLVCLDTWGMENLGRPTLGRWGPGITTQLPKETVSI
jgi:hypothetical protein